jgi:hypothetical protein
MSGNEIQVSLRVFLSPDPTQHTTWLGRGLAVRITKEDGEIVRDDLVTDIHGVTGEVMLTQETTYRVEATDPAWLGSWGCELPTGKRSETLDVWLSPTPAYRHFVLRLITDSGDPVAGGTVVVTAGPAFSQPFAADSEGYIHAVAPSATPSVLLKFSSEELAGTKFCPRDSIVPHTVPEAAHVKVIDFVYWPAIQIVAEPTVTMNGTEYPLLGTEVTVEYRVSAQEPGTSRTLTLTQPGPPAVVCFEYPFPGEYRVTVKQPSTWSDLPIEPETPQHAAKLLWPGKWTVLSPGMWTVPAEFAVVPTDEITIVVTTPDNQQLAGNPEFTVSYGSASTMVPVAGGTSKGIPVPKGIPATIALVPGTANVEATVPGGARTVMIPLKMATPVQAAVPGVNQVVLEYKYPLTVKARDVQDRPVAGAMIDIFDQSKNLVGDGVTGGNGNFVIGVGQRGTYYAAQHTMGGYPAILESGQVSSPGEVIVRIKGPDGEALTDLSAYPVLTEEISTTGVPAPGAGGTGGGGGGAAYAQVVDQAMRDVLGWRPGGDLSGFQAALTGAFQLREVEGHTEWTWQQRGYAVQADMGALTGAQAAIYARAKSALDQILPLLAGLTPLNPALFPPQDLEAIRTVINAELQELVSELALQGGPRIQRVDQLFQLLTGEKPGSKNLNPDVVQGNLGTLRDRFGLTADEIDTVDEERIVTNFRIVVEQVLSLQATWGNDRGLLAPLDPRASFGTVLIWLSRSLEAVCESVGDLNFALDSVFVDAAQRQVLELKFPGEEALLLSDLLDWVERASRDEGPRIIQDAGKDGVFAFAPVLRRLRDLIRATRHAARHDSGLPHGMRTPRVDRALQVLVAQLTEATDLAGQVRRDTAPSITFTYSYLDEQGQLVVDLAGSNFRRNATAFLFVQDREDIPDVRSRQVQVVSPSMAAATFRKPTSDLSGLTWSLVLTNEDGTSSQPVTITIP